MLLTSECCSAGLVGQRLQTAHLTHSSFGFEWPKGSIQTAETSCHCVKSKNPHRLSQTD